MKSRIIKFVSMDMKSSFALYSCWVFAVLALLGGRYDGGMSYLAAGFVILHIESNR